MMSHDLTGRGNQRWRRPCVISPAVLLWNMVRAVCQAMYGRLTERIGKPGLHYLGMDYFSWISSFEKKKIGKPREPAITKIIGQNRDEDEVL